MQRYLHKILSASGVDEAALDTLGKEGWCLTASAGDRLFLVKMVNVSPHMLGDERRYCADCANFPEKSRDAVGKCAKWGVTVQGSGTDCDTFTGRIAKDHGEQGGGHGEAVSDDLSAWHWQPDTNAGEKRIEAITSQDAGITAPAHKHRVQVIVCKKGKVIRGKTDMVNGHAHAISFIGMTDEADGHTHVWSVPAKVEG